MADTRTGAAAPILPAALAVFPQAQTDTTTPVHEPRALLQKFAGWMQASGFGPDHPWRMSIAASLAAYPAAADAADDADVWQQQQPDDVRAEPAGSSTASAAAAKVRVTVQTIDNLSQDGFSQISAIAQLALRWLEAPDGYGDLGVIAEALNLIHANAEDTKNCINVETEAVGCNYTDPALTRRQLAMAAAAPGWLQGGRHE